MSKDKDELAKLLGAMAAGDPAAPAEDSAHDAGHAPSEHVDLGRSPAIAPSPSRPPRTPPPLLPPRSIAPPAAPASRLIVPETASNPQRNVPQPRPLIQTSSRPQSPPRPAGPAPASRRPAGPTSFPGSPLNPPSAPPVPAPAPAQQIIDDTNEYSAAGGDDDAVIVPAPSSDVFAHRPPPRPRPVRQHLVKTLGFKRTIIPVLLTLGVVCSFLGLLGYLAPSSSPYSVLRSPWFAVPFILIGLVNLGFAALTMMQVKHELERQQQPAVSDGPNVR